MSAAVAEKPTAAATTAPTSTTRPPLWPRRIPVIGLTGEKWSGKTLFGLSIAPRETLIYDTELSSASYQDQLGFTRVDVMGEMLKVYPKGHTAKQRYEWWLNHVRSLPVGKYRVIVADTVNEIESGLADWVKDNPVHFGHTAAQYQKMSGIMWGDVKDLWLQIITTDLASRCETFCFVTHMGDVWSDNKPSGKRKPKGKDTLYQIASLYLQMERKKTPQGEVPQIPSAVILKERIADLAFDEATGEMKSRSVLPPRIPNATPAEMRRRMVRTWNPAAAGSEELAPEAVMTDDDRAAVQLATAEAVRDAEQAKLERLTREQTRQGRPAATTATVVTAPTATATTPPPATAAYVAPAGKATAEQLGTIAKLRSQMWISMGFPLPHTEDTGVARLAAWNAIIAKRGVSTAKDLTTAQAGDLIGKLSERLNAGVPLAGLFRDGHANATDSRAATDGEGNVVAATNGSSVVCPF